jgi:hypothetical protein
MNVIGRDRQAEVTRRIGRAALPAALAASLFGLGCKPTGPGDGVSPSAGQDGSVGSGGAGRGGSSSASGGNVAAGGAGGSGGATGGSPGTGGGGPSDAADGGGDPGSGGVPATGGTSGTGGSPGTGGMPATGYRFGSRPQNYPAGSIRPAGGQPALDAAVTSAYDKWKAAYVTAGCGGFIVKTAHGEPGEMTGSAAIGRGMIFAAMLAGHDPDAQKLFDGLSTVARMKPSRYKGNEALISYTVRAGCATTADDGSTFEGDADFSFALLLADKQWGSAGTIKYLDEAKKTIAAMKKLEMNPALHLPLSGDWASLPGEAEKGWFTDTKSANFMLGHFRAFAKSAADPFWMETVVALQKLIESTQAMYSPMAGFLPEYLDESKPAKVGYAIATDRAHAGEFGGNAGTAVLRLAADYVVSGDAATKAEFTKITDSIKKTTGGDPGKIVDGYLLAGTAFGTKGTAMFIAPLGAAAIFDAGNQVWLDGLWKSMAGAAAVDSETDSTNLLGMLIASGNWWAP